MSAAKVSVGLVQMAAVSDPSENLLRGVEAIHAAGARGAQIVCLQELFSSRYFCQEEDAAHFDLAEPIPGPSSRKIAKAAREAGVVVVASLFERRAAGIYHNTALVFGPDGAQLGVYRKMHVPDDPQYHEKFYFTPGDLGFETFQTPFARLGTLVCWDQWYPEAARLVALRGAELIVYPTAIGWLPADREPLGAHQLDAWKTMQRSHAIANGVYVIAVNRTGFEESKSGGIEFWGHSFVCDPMGVVLAEAGSEEEILVVECPLDRIEETRRGWPFLRDRRIDAYAGLSTRFLDHDPKDDPIPQ